MARGQVQWRTEYDTRPWEMVPHGLGWLTGMALAARLRVRGLVQLLPNFLLVMTHLPWDSDLTNEGHGEASGERATTEGTGPRSQIESLLLETS